MKHTITTIIFLLTCFIAIAQTDSLEIKLEQYKKLYNNGLINQSEYEALKAKALNLNPPTATITTTDTTSAPERKSESYYKRPVLFQVTISPVLNHSGAQNTTTTSSYYKSSTEGSLSLTTGGIHIQSGVSIKKRFYPGIGLGVEGSKKSVAFPIYAYLGVNLLTTKISPYINVGLGYINIKPINTGNSTNNTAKNAAQFFLGAGVNAHIARNFSFNIAPCYRLIYQRSVYNYADQFAGGSNRVQVKANYFQHELSLKLNFVLY